MSYKINRAYNCYNNYNWILQDPIQCFEDIYYVWIKLKNLFRQNVKIINRIESI